MLKLFLILLLLPGMSLHAQPITHYYDSSGNRILRCASMIETAPAAVYNNQFTTERFKNTSAVPPQVKKQMNTITPVNSTADAGFSVYPNPATDAVNITLSDEFMKQSHKTLGLYSPEGKLLRSYQADKAQYFIDLSAYAAGIYLIRLSADGYKREFNIVKQ
jgi:hypothetical protein